MDPKPPWLTEEEFDETSDFDWSSLVSRADDAGDQPSWLDSVHDFIYEGDDDE